MISFWKLKFTWRKSRGEVAINHVIYTSSSGSESGAGAKKKLGPSTFSGPGLGLWVVWSWSGRMSFSLFWISLRLSGVRVYIQIEVVR